MGLFIKKKTNKEKVVKKDEIEILDFNDISENPVNNKIDEKKDNRIILILLLIVIVFVLLVPYITSLFKDSSNYNYTTNVENDKSKGTINGLLLIGNKDGYIKIKDIQFYLFSKRNLNTISYSYKIDKTINNIPKLNLFIELYNGAQTIISREQFNPSPKLQKGVKSGELKINSQIYKEAEYAKVTQIKEFTKNIDKTLICNKSEIDGNFKIDYKNIYNFSNTSLITYEIDKKADYTPCTNCEQTDNKEKDKYNNLFKKEEANILNTNIEDVILEDNYLNYIIDLTTFDLKESDYNIPYGIGTVLKTIKLTEENNGWTCHE